MKLHANSQSSQNETRDSYDTSDPQVVKEPYDGQSDNRVNVTPRHANKKMFSNEEGRQDENIGTEEVQQDLFDNFEFNLLYKEIERIDHSFQSGSNESEETISLTSTYNNNALITRSMHYKLIRLIKAMIPNATLGQKESFIKDLFEMGIRASRNSPTRLELERESQMINQTTTTDELMIEDCNSILESSIDDSAEDRNQIQQRPNDANPTYSPYLGGDPKNAHSSYDYADGENSIIASTEEYDTQPDVEMAKSVHQSVSSRCIDTISATSSDVVDMRWEHLRNKILNSSNSNSERSNTLTSEMEKSLIRECVETGLTSSNSRQSQDGIDSAQELVIHRHGTVPPEKEDLLSVRSAEISSLHEPANEMRGVKIEEHLGPNRPGQADHSSIDQPSMQQRNTDSDSFSIDAMSNSILQDGSTRTSNAPSFDEAPMDEREGCSLEGCDFTNSREMPVQATERMENVGNSTSNRSERTHEITLHPSLKDELMLRVSNSVDVEKTKISERKSDYCTIASDAVSVDDSSRNVAKIINVKSSLTIGTDMLMPNKEPDRSFYQSVDFSQSETLENQESPDLTGEVQPSWRLSPAESFSDFMLTVTRAETGLTTNYYVHKHMMAIGPRSSQYMNEVFAAENTPNFHVTLDEKTSSLIPKILDYIYCDEYDIIITMDNAIALRQLAKMFKIVPLEMKAVRFILQDMGIQNMVTYVSDCCYFDDVEVTKAVVEKCTANIGSIPISDRLWVVMEPELFLQIVSSPQIDRRSRSKHLSVLLREYLELHQYEITVEMFVTLTSDSIIPIVDRSVALPLIELSNNYHSNECEALQKRCAFTIACYWQTTPPADRHRLFALLRNLPSSLTVDFLEVVESGRVTLEMLRSEMEEEGPIGNVNNIDEKDVMTYEDFSIGSMEGGNNEELSWRMDPEKSYSDMMIRVKYLNHDGFQIYHVHKHIVCAGAKNSVFFAQHLNSIGISVGEKVCVVIELDYEGASLVPLVLDFIYPRQSELEISNEYAVAFHYVARAFGIQALSKKITKFIEHDISLENVSDYIVEGGYYRDHMTIATAGRLCAQEIMSIDVESKLLEELEPDFFQMIVSCDAIEPSARSHVNVLIMKYFSFRNDLQDDVIEKLLDSIRVDQIERHTALNLLEMITKLNKYESIETFESMKKKSIEVLTENWVELTADDHRREEIFSILPLFTTDLLTNMFKAVDTKTRMQRKEAISQQVQIAKRCKEEIAESNRLREEEVSYLRNELEVRTTKMLDLQKQLESKLIQVDKSMARRTGRSAAAITTSPARNKINQFSENKEIMLAASAMSDQYELAKEMEEGWCCPGNGESSIDGRMMTVEEMEKISEVSEHSENFNGGESEEQQDEIRGDEQSVSTIQLQKKKGRMFC